MGLKDKLKAQAEQLAEKAQAGVAQGKDKLEEVQAKRQRDNLLEQLGAAAYAEAKQGGSHDAVVALINAIEAHDIARAADDAAEAAAAALKSSTAAAPAAAVDLTATPEPAVTE